MGNYALTNTPIIIVPRLRLKQQQQCVTLKSFDKERKIVVFSLKSHIRTKHVPLVKLTMENTFYYSCFRVSSTKFPTFILCFPLFYRK